MTSLMDRSAWDEPKLIGPSLSWALLLESGHAYRATHMQHHRVFPGPDDPEGDPAPE